MTPAYPKYSVSATILYLRRRRGRYRKIDRWSGKVLSVKAIWDEHGMIIWYLVNPYGSTHNHYVREGEITGALKEKRIKPSTGDENDR